MNNDKKEESQSLLAHPSRLSGNTQTSWKVILLCLSVVATACFVVAMLFGFNILTMETKVPGESSRFDVYRIAGVASDTEECSTIGSHFMATKGASAVDAAIATMLCVGVHQAYSAGIGGGALFTIFAKPRDGTNKTAVTIDAREVAPQAADRNMFLNASASASEGGKSIGVPGEVKGFYEAWQRFGKLPWAALFQPSIDLCRKGLRVTKPMDIVFQLYGDDIRKTPSLREAFMKEDGTFPKEGEIIKRPHLAETLKIIATQGQQAFYDGYMSETLVQDLKDHGSIITREDLRAYRVKVKTPVTTKLASKNWSVYGQAPPASGAIFQFLLNVLDGYNLSAESLSKSNVVLTYHRIIEAFKFAYAKRSYLGDEDFVDVKELLRNLTSQDYADYVRSMIDDTTTYNISYYGPMYFTNERRGTSHVSVIGPDGSGVALTSTINTPFGSMRRGSRTGIIFNSEMDDFSTPGLKNWFGMAPSPANQVEPGKRPMSSACPSIIVDAKGNIVDIYGGTGGSQITTAVAFVAAHNIWMGKRLHEAIDTARLHHQLMPNVVRYEPSMAQSIVEGLMDKGHKMESIGLSISSVEAIHINSGKDCKDTCLEAVSDKRLYGAPDGY